MNEDTNVKLEVEVTPEEALAIAQEARVAEKKDEAAPEVTPEVTPEPAPEVVPEVVEPEVVPEVPAE